jgi:microcystin-dependent protein
MASTYSTSLKIQLIGNGEQSGIWGSTTDTNWNLMEQAVAGVQTVIMANADYTLSNLNGVSDEARNMVLVIQGTNSAVYKIIVPLAPKFYVVSNQTSGGYAITVGGASGAYVTIPNGYTSQVYCDGVNCYAAQTSSAGNWNVSGNLSVGGNSTITGNSAITGNETITGNASVGGTLTVTGGSSIVPTGSLMMWSVATAPTGFLICNGAAISRTTYAALFGVVGTTFGAGDGSATFNLPDYRNNMPIGAGSAYALGATGGVANTTLATTNLPAHNHTATVTDPGHIHGVTDPTHHHGGWGESHDPWNGVYAGPGYIGSASSDYDNYLFNSTNNATGVSINSHTTGITVATANTGSGTAFTNLPPYLAIYYIIKT